MDRLGVGRPGEKKTGQEDERRAQRVVDGSIHDELLELSCPLAMLGSTSCFCFCFGSDRLQPSESVFILADTIADLSFSLGDVLELF